MFRRTASAARRSLRSRLDHEPRAWDDQRIGTKVLVVFALGTTAVVLIESTTTGAVGLARQRRVVAQAALLVASIVAVIAAVGATAVLIGRRVSWLESPTEWLLRVLGNPLLWIGLLAAVLSISAIRRRVELCRSDVSRR
jgi:sulfite exporter TauE/SafE